MSNNLLCFITYIYNANQLRLKVITFILYFVFVNHILFAQNASDFAKYQNAITTAKDDTSRINALREMSKYYSLNRTDSAILVCKRALQSSEHIGWTKGIAQNALNLGFYLISTSQFDSGIYYETKALSAAKIVGDKNRLALIYVNRGSAYTETGQYQNALPDLREAMRLSEETGNKDRQARVAQSMAELYGYQNNYEAGLPWVEKAYQLEKETGDTAMQSVAEMTLGGIFSLRGDYKKAEEYLLNAFHKAEQYDRPDVVVECCMSLSDVYIKTHRYDKAIAVTQKGIVVAQTLQTVDRVASLYENLGNAFYSNEQYKEALEAHQKGYELIKGQPPFQKNQYANLEGMAEAYNALGDFKNAYQSALLASGIKDSALLNERDEKLLRLQTEFETENKEKQIQLLKKDGQLNVAMLQKQKTFQYAAYLILGLLALIAFLVINRYRTIQRAKRLIEIEHIRNNIARNLHDDIGSTLTSINILSKVAMQQAETNVTAQSNLQKIKDRSADIMERMNDIVWAINPANDALDKIVLRMKEFGAELCEQAGIAFRFEEDTELKNVKLTLSQRNNFYLIFKEALNNAVKYSEATLITIILHKKNGALWLHIKDNGKGFAPDNAYSGNGVKNMQSRAKEMSAKLGMQSLSGIGTDIQLLIPIT